MICIECQGFKKVENRKYCSRLCRNRAISRLPRGDHMLNHMICRECGKNYLVKKSQIKRSKFCSKKCHGKVFGRRNILG